jgi:signal transduction histidine kinase
LEGKDLSPEGYFRPNLGESPRAETAAKKKRRKIVDMSSHADARLTLLGEVAAEIAHELRNALQVVSTSAYVGRAAPEKAQAQLERIAKTAEGAQRLIDDLLALARGEMESPEPVALHEVLVSAREHLDPNRVTFVDDVEQGLRFPLHARLFARVLITLFDNAVAIARHAPTIVVRARLDQAGLAMEISDDGPGVPAELGESIFEPLVSGRAGGTGLGLALARRIVVAHGGRLELGSVAPDGALFRIFVPR